MQAILGAVFLDGGGERAGGIEVILDVMDVLGLVRLD